MLIAPQNAEQARKVFFEVCQSLNDKNVRVFAFVNFLRLRGENMDGSLAQLVFYTPRGIERVKDITGKGPDHDRCGGHGHK